MHDSSLLQAICSACIHHIWQEYYSLMHAIYSIYIYIYTACMKYLNCIAIKKIANGQISIANYFWQHL